jgi:translation initiation factor 2B subunit (eIF-2B alpha/beta/delta family)
MFQQQKDQELQQMVQQKDQEIAKASTHNTTLMKGVLQLHQQVEQMKQADAQKDHILQRAAQRIQELETANQQLRHILQEVGGLSKCGMGGFDQDPRPPPAVH